jgi:hypothetical protein
MTARADAGRRNFERGRQTRPLGVPGVAVSPVESRNITGSRAPPDTRLAAFVRQLQSGR